MVGFGEKENPALYPGKPLRAECRTNKLRPQIVLNPQSNPGYTWWRAIALTSALVTSTFFFVFFARKMVLSIWNANFVSLRLTFFPINSVLRKQFTFGVRTLRCFRHRVYTLHLWLFVDKALEFSDCDYILARRHS